MDSPAMQLARLLTGNAWSEEARQAAAEARRASTKAKETGKKSDHEAAAKLHRTAAALRSPSSAGHTEHLMSAAYHAAKAKGITPAGFN